uniref:(northern house mosquito) hypothetical protein n=1 Tax=Culex pipiens TaxID=7175 RepID=A0A8D8GIR1_CULPI
MMIRILPHSPAHAPQSLPNPPTCSSRSPPVARRGNFHSRRKINKLVHKHSPWRFPVFLVSQSGRISGPHLPLKGSFHNPQAVNHYPNPVSSRFAIAEKENLPSISFSE